MAVELTVKNTFFDIIEDDAVESNRRSSSVPRSWKPAGTPIRSPTSKQTEKHLLWSDVSTVADDECSDHEVVSSSGALSSADSDGAASEHPEEAPKKTLCLSEAISEVERERRTKLSSKARSFAPVVVLPSDMRMVCMAGHAAISASPKISNIQISEGMVGGYTSIVGSYKRGSLNVGEKMNILSIVKMAILDAAAGSENTYVLGYEKTPFNDVGHASFSAKLGTVLPIQENSTCWTTYQKGFCPRRATCRWCHPQENDLAHVVFTLNEVDH